MPKFTKKEKSIISMILLETGRPTDGEGNPVEDKVMTEKEWDKLEKKLKEWR